MSCDTCPSSAAFSVMAERNSSCTSRSSACNGRTTTATTAAAGPACQARQVAKCAQSCTYRNANVQMSRLSNPIERMSPFTPNCSSREHAALSHYPQFFRVLVVVRRVIRRFVVVVVTERITVALAAIVVVPIGVWRKKETIINEPRMRGWKAGCLRSEHEKFFFNELLMMLFGQTPGQSGGIPHLTHYTTPMIVSHHMPHPPLSLSHTHTLALSL